ncbi:hypothetical protein ACOPJQ_09120 [Luteimonas dalianensis]|uniref:hypothetical protein n=1 Tax=Luteimonas dalianensis TaxID=1148196 RepID=UPI003BF16288
MIAAAIPLLLTLASSGSATVAERPQLDCHTGPVTKTYGETDWLVYSCSDNRSIVVVAKPDNPAFEFYFILVPGTDDVELYGEGVGDKAATEPAFQELELLSPKDVAAVVAETKGAGGR